MSCILGGAGQNCLAKEVQNVVKPSTSMNSFCDTKPCQNGGTCTSTDDGYTCSCGPGE